MHKGMKRYDGILLCTDLDHTLIADDGSIPQNNIEALKYFMANGGMFTLASGRAPQYLKQYHDRIIPNVPVICHNGATVYDYKAEKYLRTVFLDEEYAADAFLYAVNNFLGEIKYMGLYDRDELIMYKTDGTSEYTVDEYIKKFYSIKKNKYLISVKTEAVAKHIREKFVNDPKYAGKYEFARSWSYGVEVLPLNGNKASGVNFLAEHLGNVTKTVSVGDFENDISMLKYTDESYAVENACDSAKAAAKHITVSNNAGALAKVIELL